MANSKTCRIMLNITAMQMMSMIKVIAIFKGSPTTNTLSHKTVLATIPNARSTKNKQATTGADN